MSLKIFILIIIIMLLLIRTFRRKAKINLFDILILSHLLFFGIYPIIDLLSDNYFSELDVFLFSVSFVVITLGLLQLLFIVLVPNKIKRTFSLKLLVQKASLVRQNYISFSFLIAASIIFYFFLSFNLIFRVVNEELYIVNTYRQIISNVVLPLLTFVSICSLTKILNLNYHKQSKFISYVFFLLITLYWLFYGRREFIFHILIMGLIWFTTTKRQIDFKAILYGLLGIVFMAIGSNIYQNIREDLLLYSVNEEFDVSKDFLEMALDFETTGSNLERRSSALPLLSKSIESISNIQESSKGEILMSSVVNSIPNIFLVNKVYTDNDLIINRQLKMPFKDVNTNLYTCFYIDFVYLSWLILPLFLFIYFFTVAASLFYLRNSHIMFVLVFLEGISASYNVETPVSDILVSMRQIFLIVIIYFIFNKFLHTFFKIKL